MTQFAYQYALYGVTLHSNRPLPGLPPVRAEHSVVITVDFAGALQERPAGAPFFTNGFETLWHLDAHSWLLQYEHAELGYTWTAAYDSRENSIVLRWSHEAITDDIPAVLQGPAIAAALHLRNIPLLHACVLAVDAFAIAFLGAAGAGKSTTAAAFVATGYALASDDLAALQIHSDHILVEAGYPRLRMYADSARAAGWDGHLLPRAFRATVLGDKRYAELPAASFCAEALPLRAIYLLRPRSPLQQETVIAGITQRAAIPLLMQNLYSGRFLDRRLSEQSFGFCTRITELTAVRSVTAPDDLSKINALVTSIAADARRLQP